MARKCKKMDDSGGLSCYRPHYEVETKSSSISAGHVCGHVEEMGRWTQFRGC